MDAKTEQVLLESRDRGLLTLTLNRPERRNALNAELGLRLVEAATHHEPMATVRDPSLHHGEASPVKETLAFGAQALRERLPIPRTERLLGNAGHIREQEACPCLHTDHLDGGDGQGIRQALLLQEGAQGGTVPVDGIGHHPAAVQAGSLGALDHQLA